MKRRRREVHGCYFALDVNNEPRRDPSATLPPGEVFDQITPLKKECLVAPEGCKKKACLGRKARILVRYLHQELGLERVHPLPPRISCGQFRPAIRSVFPRDIPLIAELSIKTAQKVETEHCKPCALKGTEMLNEWKKKQLRSVQVNLTHLDRFKKALAINVPTGWDKFRTPYIPNGHATESYIRKKGGNWNLEDFSDTCRAELVFSCGKPRIVTLYATRNLELLTPLHDSLYRHLKRKGWLLVGGPTADLIANLNGEGPYQSVDYQSATDNIKGAYVRAAVEVLEEKAHLLSADEREALRVLSNLRFDDSGEVAEGQPMGSPMSFPLLCLINKAVVDLALADLLEQGEISWKQFYEHRCLINGDDLAFREFSTTCGIFERVVAHGTEIGLITNKEKTLTSTCEVEINSTLFQVEPVDGVIRRKKKINLGALFMDDAVSDVLGMAADSSISIRGFVELVDRNRRRLAMQEQKIKSPLPKSCFGKLHLWKKELSEIPAKRLEAPNPFPVEAMPDGFTLSREEGISVINREVVRLREWGYRPLTRDQLKALRGPYRVSGRAHWRWCLKTKRTTPQDTVLRCLKREWERKEKEKVVAADTYVHPSVCVGDGSVIEVLLDHLRAFKRTRPVSADRLNKTEGKYDQFKGENDYVALT